MQDGQGRQIDYLRISVTDKCNLRCKYCMPPNGVDRIPHKEILRLEEIARVVHIMAGMGITKVRLTGGEPLVRKNLVKLVEDIHRIDGIQEIAMTTNGVLLAENVIALKKAGLTSVNISLDTLNPSIYEMITGMDVLTQVLQGIDQALQQGLQVKINCVPCKEWNVGELREVAGLAAKYPLDVRFIELMPIGCGKDYHGIASAEVQEELEAVYGKAAGSQDKRGNGPAFYVDFEGFQGKIGFISPLSHRFCQSCNRVRLTAEGYMKLCLHYNTGMELRPLLRSNQSDEEIKDAIRLALKNKPTEHDFRNTEALVDSDTRRMVQIGG